MQTVEEVLSELEALKKINKKLNESFNLHKNQEAIYQDIFELAFDGFFVISDVIIDCNPAVEKLLGRSKREIVGATPSVFSPPYQDNSCLTDEIEKDYIKRAFNGEKINFEWCFEHSSGKLIYCDVILKRIVNDKSLLIAVLRDVTEDKKHNDKLIIRDRSLDFALQSGRLGFWLYNIPENKETVNVIYNKILMLETEETELEPLLRKKRIHIHDLKIFNNIYKQIFDGKISNYDLQYRIRNKYNRWIWVEERGQVIEYDENFLPKTISGTILDINKIKDSELTNSAILKISKLADSKDNVLDLYKAIHDLLGSLMPCENIFIAIYDKENNVIRFPYAEDQYDEFAEIAPFGNGLTEYVIKTGQSLLCDTETQKKLSETEGVAVSGEDSPIWLGVPLIVDGETIGVLAVQDYDYEDTYQEREQQILEIIGAEVAHALKRKDDELALLESENKFRQIAESLPGVVYVYDILPDGTRTTRYSGPGMNQLLGSKDFEDRYNDAHSFFGIIHPDDLTLINEKAKTHGDDDKPFDVDYRLVYNEKEFWVRSISKSVPLENGETRVIGVLIDISEQKETQEKLVKSEEKYHSLLNNINHAILEISFTGEILFTNSSFTKITGYEDYEVIGDSIFNYLTNKKYNNFLTDSGQLNSGNMQIKGKNGKPLEIKYEIMHRYDNEMNIIGLVIIFSDETENKIMRKQLQMRQKMDSLGALASGIAHDFNNLLSVITGNLDMLLMIGENFTEQQKKCIHSGIRSTSRASDLIKKIQSLSRPTLQEVSDVNIYLAIQEVVEMLDKTTHKLIEKKIAVDDREQFIQINPTELNQVLLNLATNSNYAINEKGLKPTDYIKISAEPLIIKDDNKYKLATGEYCHIIVEDTGAGMPEEIKRRAFEPLFSTRIATGKGQGLGLAMVYSIVASNNGVVEIETEVGVGTKIHLLFPLVKTENSLEVVVEEVVGGKEKILLVEDEPSISLFIYTSLLKYGYEVDLAENGEIALDYYKKNNYDLVVTDIIMPKMSGELLINEIKRINDIQKTIIVSGYDKTEFDQNLIESCDGFMAKPFRLNNLLILIRKVLKCPR